MRGLGHRARSVIGTALIVLFFSEFYFLNEAPVRAVLSGRADPTGTVLGLLELAAWYTLFAWGFLILLHRFRVARLSGLLLAGALFGWAVEALVIPLAHEAPPFSWIFPPVGWHALVDVMLGWYGLRLAMRRLAVLPLAGIFVLAGLVWAVWATWFWGPGFQGPSDMAPLTPGEFAFFTALTGTIWIGGMALADAGDRFAFAPGRGEVWLVGLVWAGLYALTGAAFLPWSAGLALLAGLALVALAAASRHGTAHPPLTQALTSPPPRARYALAVLLPASAALGYLPVYALGLPLAGEWAILLLLAGGTAVLVWAFWQAFTTR